MYCHCVIRYLKIPPCKSILGLYKRFPSLVIDEIKCYKGGGRGGPLTPEGDSLHQCKLSGVTLYTIVQNVRVGWGGGGGGGGGEGRGEHCTLVQSDRRD